MIKIKPIAHLFLTLVIISIILLASQVLFNDDLNTSFPRVRSSSSHKAPFEMKKARWEYFHRLLRDPQTNQIPKGIRRKELAYARGLPRVINALKKANSTWFLWEEAGPVDVGGRTRALAVDVTNSNLIIAGGVSGGIWKSTDQGITWNLKNDPSQNLSVTSLAQDTRAGFTNTWYYATGEFIANSANDRGATAFYQGSGIFKSTDSGESWQILPITINNDPTVWDSPYNYVSRIVVHPVTGSIFVASHGVGVLRSDNGGDSFSLVLGEVNDHYFSDVIVTEAGTIVAVLSELGFNTGAPVYAPGIYKSTEDGIKDFWTDITPATFPETHRRTVLAAAPSNPDVLYALTNTGNTDVEGDEDIRLHKIAISTGSYVNLSANIPDYDGDAGNFNTQNNYNMVIAVKPDDENFVLIGATNLYRSTNGFSSTLPQYYTWFGGYHPKNDISQYPGQHPDQHVITFDPADPNKMWCGHDGGLSYTADITTNSTSTSLFPWIDKNQGYNVTQFYTIAIPDQAGDDRIMGGTQDNGTPFFTWDGVEAGPSNDVSFGDGAYCYFGNSFAYTSAQNGQVWRLKYGPNGTPSFSEGWSKITPTEATGQLFINPFRIDPNDEDVIYYAAGKNLWRNNQLGRLPDRLEGTTNYWTILTNLAVEDNYVISTLAISQQPSHILYYAASDASSSSLPPKIYRLDNATTETMVRKERSISTAAGGAYVHCVAINPENADEILVVLSNYNITGLYHSSNGGESYKAVEGNLEGPEQKGPSLRSATILPGSVSATYLVGTSTGVYSTKILNGSNTIWSQEGAENIGNVVVEYIASRPSDDRVAVATHGRGIFIGSRDPSYIRDVSGENIPSSYVLKQNYPNPFNPATTIEFTLPHSQFVTLKVFNALGQQVVTLIESTKQAGSYKVLFKAEGLPSGLYFYQLNAGQFKETKKCLLVK